ncbi:ankyrin-3-like [Trichogramma pretiosum]|uniref:ankyrin-3-like n=1 Tax=Trichogramma pretiosum TaxID=7493 RepID=UPI0006C9550D|nr:ankyrin-3-like [Trichogramma pretiosum]
MMDLKTLKILDLGIKADRSFFLSKLYPIISQWEGEPPKLLESFESKEIEWLLIEEIENSKIVSFLDFVIKTSYKDKPKYDKNNVPLWIRRTTAMHRAVRNKADNEVIPKLFDIYNRFDLNYIDETGLTHYHVACMLGLADTVQKFLEHGQDPNYLAQKLVDPPLHLSLTYRHKVLAQLLLRSGADPNSINEKKMTPLHIICKTRCDDIETANMLLEFSNEKNQLLQVNAQDKFGMTPLHYSLCSNNLKLSEFLLRKGAVRI